VAAAVPSGVLPGVLYSAFTRSQEWPLNANQYRNGESQREILTGASRKSWEIGERLTPAQVATLAAFFASHGLTTAFYFYDRWETSPQFSYDETGVSLTGRYIVRFDGEFGYAANRIMLDAKLRLVEVN